jgi:hypothetical protein
MLAAADIPLKNFPFLFLYLTSTLHALLEEEEEKKGKNKIAASSGLFVVRKRRKNNDENDLPHWL